MDKITLHSIQMNSSLRSLHSRVSDVRASDSEVSNSTVSEASDTWVSKVSDMSLGGLEFESLVSDPSISDPRPGLGGLGLETFSGSDLPGLRLGPMNFWACLKLIHDPTPLMKQIEIMCRRKKKLNVNSYGQDRMRCKENRHVTQSSFFYKFNRSTIRYVNSYTPYENLMVDSSIHYENC
jgi:hypothetical protein